MSNVAVVLTLADSNVADQIRVTMTDSTGGNAPMVQTVDNTTTSLTFVVPAGIWTATASQVDAAGNPSSTVVTSNTLVVAAVGHAPVSIVISLA